MARNRAKVPQKLDLLSRDDWENIINQYIRSEEDRKIAILYYLDGWCQEDIAATVNYSRKTICKRLQKILNIITRNTQ